MGDTVGATDSELVERRGCLGWMSRGKKDAIIGWLCVKVGHPLPGSINHLPINNCLS